MLDACIPRKAVDVIAMLVEPAIVIFGDNGSNIQEVAVVKVVVVVVAVSKIHVCIISAGFVDYATPGQFHMQPWHQKSL